MRSSPRDRPDRLRVPRLPVADPSADLPPAQPRQPPRPGLQGGGHDHDALRHGRPQQHGPIPARDRLAGAAARSGRRRGTTPCGGSGRSSSCTERTSASTGRTCRRSATGAGRAERRRVRALATGPRCSETLIVGKDPQTTLEAAGREVVVTNPDKVFFPKAGHTKLDLVRYYARGRGGRAARHRRPADRPQALRRRRRGGAVLPEARAREAPRVDRDRRAALSLGAHGARDRRARRGAAPVDREPRLHRPESAPGARRRPRASRRAARRSRPRPGRRAGTTCGG